MFLFILNIVINNFKHTNFVDYFKFNIPRETKLITRNCITFTCVYILINIICLCGHWKLIWLKWFTASCIYRISNLNRLGINDEVEIKSILGQHIPEHRSSSYYFLSFQITLNLNGNDVVVKKLKSVQTTITTRHLFEKCTNHILIVFIEPIVLQSVVDTIRWW